MEQEPPHASWAQGRWVVIADGMFENNMGLEQLLAIEADVHGVLFGSEDLSEGRAAFVEKRRRCFAAAERINLHR
jgi:hypothetical protein